MQQATIQRQLSEEGTLLDRILELALESSHEASKFRRLAEHKAHSEGEDWPERQPAPLTILNLARETLEEYLSSARFSRSPLARGDGELPLQGQPTNRPLAAREDHLETILRFETPLGRLAVELVGLRGLHAAPVAAGLGVNRVHLETYLSRLQASSGEKDLARLGRVAARIPVDVVESPLTHTTLVRGLAAGGRNVSQGVVGSQETLDGARGAGPRGPGSSDDGRGLASRDPAPRATAIQKHGGAPTGNPRERNPYGLQRRPGAAAPTSGSANDGRRWRNLSLAFLGMVLAIGWFPMRASSPSAATPAVTSGLAVPSIDRPPGAFGSILLPSGPAGYLTPGKQIVAPRIGTATLRYDDGSRILLEADAVAVCDLRRLELKRGTARLDIAPDRTAFVGTASPIQVTISSGTFVLVKPGSGQSGSVTGISGEALAAREDGGTALTLTQGREVSLDGSGQLEISESRTTNVDLIPGADDPVQARAYTPRPDRPGTAPRSPNLYQPQPEFVSGPGPRGRPPIGSDARPTAANDSGGGSVRPPANTAQAAVEPPRRLRVGVGYREAF